MSAAFVFPGQGSQAVGMGKDLAAAFPQAKAVFDEVDAALGQKLSQIMWEGPAETLTLTENAQPALMAVSMAVMRVLEAEGVKLGGNIIFVAGHSLGEYSALAAAGTFSLARHRTAAETPRSGDAEGIAVLETFGMLRTQVRRVVSGQSVTITACGLLDRGPGGCGAGPRDLDALRA